MSQRNRRAAPEPAFERGTGFWPVKFPHEQEDGWGSRFPTLAPEKRRKDGARDICGAPSPVHSCRNSPPAQTPPNYSKEVALLRFSIFRLGQRSLVRGILLALGSLAASLRLAGFPNLDAPHTSRWQVVPVLASCWAMVETARCLRRHWSLYHAGVLILLYAELMILALALFFWLYLL